MSRVAKEGRALAWERRVGRQRQSRLSIAEFCSQEGAPLELVTAAIRAAMASVLPPSTAGVEPRQC